ncbi:MAG: hypothetical protein ACYSU0_15220 [Planctomycetota bacterium]|jgi:hypothetical protein
MIQPTGAAFVVAAQSFNPSIFTQLWLVREGLVEEGTLGGPSVASSEVAQHQVSGMQLLVVPPRLQLTFQQEDASSAAKGKELVRKVVEKLPHTPIQALGINLNYDVLYPDGDEFAMRDRALFLPRTSPLADVFGETNARFGGYFSRDVDGMRLKLDVKPLIPAGAQGTGDKLHFNFNHHVDLAGVGREDKVETIGRALERWDELKVQAEDILKRVEAFEIGG